MSIPQAIEERLLLPVMVAPMFLCSSVDLVSESCKAGLIGTLTRNHCRSDDEFEGQVAEVRNRLAAFEENNPGKVAGPLAANISVNEMPDARRAALETCRRHSVDIVVTAGGDPTAMAAMVHDWGGRIFHDVTAIRFAEKAIAAGVDGVIAIGAGGGGHSGVLSHLSFVPQLRAMFDGTIVAAGAIASGAAIRAMEILGADLVYMGTRFIATQESMAFDEYKEMLVSQMPADLVYTAAVNGVPAMWMLESMRRNGVQVEALLSGSLPASEAIPADVTPWRNLWSAGQGVGLIHDIPHVAELAERLRDEYACAVNLPCTYPLR